MGTCDCHWARGRREAPAAKVAAGGRMPQGRTRIRTAALLARRSTDCHGFAPPATERQLPWLRTAAADVRNHGGGAVGRNAKCTCDTRLLLPSVRKALRTLNRGKICTSCMIRGICAAKRAPSWQDIHVVYPPTAICRAFRMHGTHILPKPAHFEYTTAIHCHEGALFPSEAFLGYTGAKYCHRQTPGNA